MLIKLPENAIMFPDVQKFDELSPKTREATDTGQIQTLISGILVKLDHDSVFEGFA